MQEFVSYAYAFVQQSSGILPEIEDQSLHLARLREAVERLLHFLVGGFVELRNVHVADARTNQEMKIDAVARNLIADNRKFQRLFGAFTQDSDMNRGAFRSLQQISHVTGGHVVGGFAIDRRNNV